ncbi:ADP-ribosylglycohydrolase family protein [Actinomadura sp. HBU206391]|uniref:ADP-ribosylglycohydrolase family protein n=1 Tax=Actinomadura sp. HBU206391 TaxID=2731692 RepID=UPI00164F1E13|nr:ADP-ribosylglycohydrolase family protein [Actinomadura sp. HBU206391]MBC6459082.1 ADP-ribosylglycohydrolase family protein [Actinomadura sp. HBU206391]
MILTHRPALDSLTGLSVGDAFGDQFFLLSNRGLSASVDLPAAPWEWSDDTEMACSVLDVLLRCGSIDQDALARAFATRLDIGRRYGAGALELLERVRDGERWQTASVEAFGGNGSYGNGAAMRVAPLGAYFAGDPERAAAEAVASAEVTHAHPEGVAGAVAVAVAASLAAAGSASEPDSGPAPGSGPPDASSGFVAGDLIEAALDLVPAGQVRRGLDRALGMRGHSVERAAHDLGNGSRITAPDTVPFTLWVAARHGDDYEAAVRACVAVGGDVDTTAAIVGGIVAARVGAEGIPAAWRAAREPLPAWAPLG